jgi:hypothetical protein
MLQVVESGSDSDYGSYSGSHYGSDSWSTFIFWGSRMGQGKSVVSSFRLVPENQGVGASFRLDPKN